MKLLLALLLGVMSARSVLAGCQDCIEHEISSQARCTEVTRKKTGDCRWEAGLDTNVDFIIEGGDIVAYQIEWFTAGWSGWYVTGVNDIDWKYNLATTNCPVPQLKNHMRRVWSYFSDHTHRFIICRHRSDYTGTPAPCPDPVNCDRTEGDAPDSGKDAPPF